MTFRSNGLSLLWLIALAAVIGIAGAGFFFNRPNSDNNNSVAVRDAIPEPQDSGGKKESKGTVITTGNSEYGTMLFNDAGQAIYIWELEESAKPECYGDCAEDWPPVLTDEAPRATGSVNESLLGTTKRSDGSTQVTYNGHPLYYYAHEKAGEVKCHNVRTHGGLWWVIQPDGTRAQ